MHKKRASTKIDIFYIILPDATGDAAVADIIVNVAAVVIQLFLSQFFFFRYFYLFDTNG